MQIAEQTSGKLDPREEHFRIPSCIEGLRLFLRHTSPSQASAGAPKVALYVHGGTFPSALSIAHRFDGYSWRDALCAAGFDVWGFDFLGYGHSDRYPEMSAAVQVVFLRAALERSPRNLAFERIVWARRAELPHYDFLAADRRVISRLICGEI